MSAITGVPPSARTPDTVKRRVGTHDGAPTPETAPLRARRQFSDKAWQPSEIAAFNPGSNGHEPQTGR